MVRNKWKPAAIAGVFDPNNNAVPWRSAVDVAACEIEIAPLQKVKIFGVYAHLDDPAEPFGKFLAAVPDNAVVCGDMNAILEFLPHTSISNTLAAVK